MYDTANLNHLVTCVSHVKVHNHLSTYRCAISALTKPDEKVQELSRLFRRRSIIPPLVRAVMRLEHYGRFKMAT